MYGLYIFVLFIKVDSVVSSCASMQECRGVNRFGERVGMKDSFNVYDLGVISGNNFRKLESVYWNLLSSEEAVM